MKEIYSSKCDDEKIYTTLELKEPVSSYPGSIKIGCWVENSDSRSENSALTKEESIRLLRLALDHLETK